MGSQLITPIDLTQFKLIPEDPYFVPTFAHELDELDPIDSTLAGIQAAETGVDILGALGALASIEDGIGSQLSAFPQDTGSASIDSLARSSGAIDAGVSTANLALSAATAKAVSIAVPITSLTGINVLPPTPAPAPQPPPIAPLPPVGSGGIGPTPTGFGLTLQNLTRPGAEGIEHVGDRFNVQITGPPGANIYITATHNGRQLPTAGMGIIPASGVLNIGGSFGAGDKGNWIEDWYHDRVLIREIAFEVF